MKKSELRKLIKEIIDYEGLEKESSKIYEYSVPDKLEKRHKPLYDKLVPNSGNAGTLEGEMLRAINRIIYRYYNDGDYFYTGYGIETAGYAHAFLTQHPSPLQSKLESLFNRSVDVKGDEEYEKVLNEALELILNFIESKDGNYIKDNVDLFDYSPLNDKEEDYYDDEDYY